MIVRNVVVALANVTDGTSAVDHAVVTVRVVIVPVVTVRVAIVPVATDMVAETVVITIEIVSDAGIVTIGRDHEIAAILDQNVVVVIAMIVVVARLDRPEN